MRKSLATLALGLVLAFPAGAAVDTWKIDEDHSTVSFQVRHLLTKVRGQFDAFEGTVRMDPQNPETGSVEFSIDAASIDTDSEKRDEHLRAPDFFDVAKHPRITFKSSRVRPLGPGRYAVAGILTIHGVSREVTLPVELLGVSKDPWGGTRVGFAISIALDRKDYGIDWNQALDAGGYLLGDDVEVDIQLEALREAQPAR